MNKLHTIQLTGTKSFTLRGHTKSFRNVYPAMYPTKFIVYSCMPDLGYCTALIVAGHFCDCAEGRRQRWIHDSGDECAS